MANCPASSIEILLRLDGGPAVEADGSGSYRCQGKVALDADGFGPSAIRIQFPGPVADSFLPPTSGGEIVSLSETADLFVLALVSRMRAAGAELDPEDEDASIPVFPPLGEKPFRFVCRSILEAENTALGCLSLAFGRQADIRLWSIGAHGNATAIDAGPVAREPRDDAIGAVIRFGCAALICDEESDRLQNIAVGDHAVAAALSQSDMASLDKSLPNFVSPLPGDRLEAIAALLSCRYREKLSQALPPGQGLIPVLGHREIDGIPQIDIDISITTAMPDISAMEKAARGALGASGVLLRASGSPDEVSKQALKEFHAAKCFAALLRQKQGQANAHSEAPRRGDSGRPNRP